MPRLSRVVATGIPHHITQRGNAQRPVFEDDTDRLVYLRLLGLNCESYDLAIVGYCLMPNHVHLVAIPGRDDSMKLALRHTHGRYATYLNGRQGATGHVWQGRFYSCPLDANHFWAALRYTEMNPVRAGMVADPAVYCWSSAASHCGRAGRSVPLHLTQKVWRDCWSARSWRDFLDASSAAEETLAIRTKTHSGRPLGTADFVDSLERTLRRTLAPERGGRPRKQVADAIQPVLAV